MNQMAYERQILLAGGPVPRRSVALLSVCAHMAALVLVVVLLRAGGPHIVPAKKEMVEGIAGRVHLAFKPAAAKALPHVAPSLLSLRRRRVRGRRPETRSRARRYRRCASTQKRRPPG